MGQWTIVIEGAGAHHGQNENDADRLARIFVDELTRAGHSISNASFSNSSRETLTGARNPEK